MCILHLRSIDSIYSTIRSYESFKCGTGKEEKTLERKGITEILNQKNMQNSKSNWDNTWQHKKPNTAEKNVRKFNFI
jgi:hypothetical protein